MTTIVTTGEPFREFYSVSIIFIILCVLLIEEYKRFIGLSNEEFLNQNMMK